MNEERAFINLSSKRPFHGYTSFSRKFARNDLFDIQRLLRRLKFTHTTLANTSYSRATSG